MLSDEEPGGKVIMLLQTIKNIQQDKHQLQDVGILGFTRFHGKLIVKTLDVGSLIELDVMVLY